MHDPPPDSGPTARIFAIHGVVDAVNPQWLSHYNFLDREKFARHLQARPAPFVDLEAALAGEGDALTIDDATGAGRAAAEIARAGGHQVTLFVNPENVLARSTHSFALLCLVLDRARVPALVWREQPFDLGDFKGRLALRQHVKRELATLALESDRNERVRELAEALQVADRSVPEFFQTLDEPALRELSRRGGRIGNHGWTHAAIAALPAAGVKAEIVRARRWIEENFASGAGAYAVPYGKGLPPFPLAREVCTHWLLHDNALPPGPRGPGIFNREKLRL